MSYTPIGLDTAREVLEAMRLATARFWFEWGTYYDRASEERKEELQKELQEILEACRAAGGDWEHIDFDPTTGDGLNRQVFTLIWQDSAAPAKPVAIWLKTDEGVRDWSKVWPVSVPAADDHLVKARNADATTVGGLMEKTINSPTIERTLTVDGDGVEVVVFNTLAQADPISFESTLYAAHLDDALLLPQVACGFFLATGGGHEIIAFKYDWDNLRPGVWRCKFPGITLPQGYCRGVTPVAGMRVFVGYLGEDGYPEAEMNANDKPRTGIYQFTDPGRRWLEPNGPYEDTYAVLERVDELDAAVEFQTGVLAYIAGGTDWAGKYARLTTTGTIVLETTPLEWELLSSYAPTAADNLLTAAQLARASETPNTTALVASDGSPSAWLEFPTLAGTPNLDTYRAGRTEAHVLARLHIAGAAGSITWLECQVVRDPGGDDEVLETINTSPITNQTDEVIKAHIDDDEDQDLAGDRIGLRIRARSDSATPAAIAVTWSDPAHSTRLLTPMTLAVGGSDDHQALTMTSRGFVAGEEEDARAYRHTMESIRPGLITWNTGPTVATVDGLLTLPPHTNAVRISGTDTLLGIATAGMTQGTVIYVETSASRMIRNGGVTPEGYAAFDFHEALGFSASPWAFLAPDDAAMVLGLSGTSTWRVLSAPWAEPQRAFWPATCAVTINTTDAPGLLVLPAGCPGVVYVTGTELRAITVDDADGNAQAGPLAALKLHFIDDCRLYHDDPLSGWDAGLAARAAKLDLLPPEDAEGDDRDWSCKAKRTMRLVLNTLGTPRTWIREIDQ